MLHKRIMIHDYLLPALRKKYGDAFVEGNPLEFIAQFPAKHEKVGSLLVYENEDSIIFELENISHDHLYFENNDGTLRYIPSIVREAMQYVEELFDDRILMGLQKDLMGSVIIPLFEEDDPYAFMEPQYDYFVWSGPLDNSAENNGSPAEQ